MRKTLPILLTLTMLTVATTARAEPVLYTAVLLGSLEEPPNTSPGAGITLVGYDAEAQTLSVMVAFRDLTAPTIASHIHCCVDPLGTAGVATAVPTFPDFPLGVMNGLYDRTFDLTDPSSFNPDFVMANGGTLLSAELALAAGLNAGRAYLNIHSSEFPAGEIRGFLQRVGGPAAPIPEPATLLMIAGGAGVLIVRRRRASRAMRHV